MGKIKQASADRVTTNAKCIFMLIQCKSEGWGESWQRFLSHHLNKSKIRKKM